MSKEHSSYLIGYKKEDGKYTNKCVTCGNTVQGKNEASGKELIEIIRKYDIKIKLNESSQVAAKYPEQTKSWLEEGYHCVVLSTSFHTGEGLYEISRMAGRGKIKFLWLGD